MEKKSDETSQEIEIKIDDIPSTSPFDIPGAAYYDGLDAITRLVNEKREEWGIDVQEVLIGLDNMPPSDPNCLVYLGVAKTGMCYEEFFRKDLKPGGRWVSKSYMHHVRRESKEKGTFDYSNDMAYI